MARKIFPEGKPQAEASPSPAPQKQAKLPGSVGGLRDSLREITANSIRDIDVSRIAFDGLRDRLVLEDASIDELAESIRKHGQQVPIMVRPGDQPDMFRIVYGRRRLAAIRKLGGTVKAIVRNMDDEASIIAQGQENNLRLDPSFIEKALFIRDMETAGYKPAIIQDALGLSRQGVSNHRVVISQIPEDIVRRIGAAHGVGRRQWSALASHLQGEAVCAAVRETLDALPETSTSAERFEAVQAAAKPRGVTPRPSQPPKPMSKHERAFDFVFETPGAMITTDRNAISLSIKREDHPEFSSWIEANCEDALRELYNTWLKKSGAGR